MVVACSARTDRVLAAARISAPGAGCEWVAGVLPCERVAGVLVFERVAANLLVYWCASGWLASERVLFSDQPFQCGEVASDGGAEDEREKEGPGGASGDVVGAHHRWSPCSRLLIHFSRFSSCRLKARELKGPLDSQAGASPESSEAGYQAKCTYHIIPPLYCMSNSSAAEYIPNQTLYQATYSVIHY
jgi:hypothetical protein